MEEITKLKLYMELVCMIDREGGYEEDTCEKLDLLVKHYESGGGVAHRPLKIYFDDTEAYPETQKRAALLIHMLNGEI